MTDSDLAHQVRPGRSAWPVRAVLAGIVMVAGALLATAASAERDRVAGSVKVLIHLQWIWLPAAILLEALSMGAFASMFRRLLTAGRLRPRRAEMQATVYAANAMSVTVPLAGPGLATAYLFRRFTRQGASALLAGWSLLAGGVITTVAWFIMLAGGGLVSGQTVAVAITVPVVALVLVATATFVIAAYHPPLRRSLENGLSRVLRYAARLLRWSATDPKLAVRAWAERFGALRLFPRSLGTDHW